MSTKTRFEQKYSSTMQPFLMNEVIAVAQRMVDGYDRDEIKHEAIEEDLFQLDAPESRKVIFNAVYSRLQAADPDILQWISEGPSELARFCNLYLMLTKSRLMREMLEELVLEHFLLFQTTLTKGEIDRFFDRKREQSPVISKWTEVTLTGAQRFLTRSLMDAGILTEGDPWMIQPTFVPEPLRNYLKSVGQEGILKLMLDRSG